MDEEYIDLTAPEQEAPQETTTETPKDAEVSDTQGESAEKGEETGEKTEETEGGEKKSLPGSQKQKLRAQRLAAELEQTRRELEAMRQQLQPPSQGRANVNEPRIEDFDSVEAYVGAKADFVARQRFEQYQYEQLERNAREQNAKQQAEWAHKMESAINGSEEAVEAIQEFTYFAQEAERKAPAVATAVGAALRESDIGPELVIHLGQHPDVMERLVGMSPMRAVAEIGKLESVILAKKETPKPKQVQTSAPPPPKPIKAVGSAPSKAPDVMDIDY